MTKPFNEMTAVDAAEYAQNHSPIPKIKTPLIYWIHAIEFVFSIIIGFTVSFWFGVLVFVFGETLLGLLQKEMSDRFKIALNEYMIPELNKLQQKLKDAESTKKIKFLIGRSMREKNQGETKINFDNVISIEKYADWQKIVRTKDGKGYIFDITEIIEE